MAHVALSTVRRLSLYLQFLEECERQGLSTVSSRALAERGGSTPAQVRKDLSCFGSFGKRGIGYPATELAARIRAILGLGRPYRVIVVGAGRIGAALASYPGFAERGFHIDAIYDVDPAKVGRALDGRVVRDAKHIEDDLRHTPTDVAVIGTPSEAAQAIADRLVEAGIRAILNFAAVTLVVPPGVTVANVNMALEFEALAFALNWKRD